MSHENLERIEQIEISSERHFGIVISIFFVVLSLWPLLFHNAGPHWWALAAAAGMVLLAWKAPQKLKTANRLWHKLGLLLGRIVSPIALAIVFFGVITPLGLLARARNKDFLKMKKEPNAKTYWHERHPPGPAPRSLDRQY